MVLPRYSERPFALRTAHAVARGRSRRDRGYPTPPNGDRPGVGGGTLSVATGDPQNNKTAKALGICFADVRAVARRRGDNRGTKAQQPAMATAGNGSGRTSG